MESEEKKVLVVPKGFEKYEVEDFTLLEGEEVKSIIAPTQLAFLRPHVFGILSAIFGLSLYVLFAMPLPIRVSDLIIPVTLFILLYFVYHAKPTKTARDFVLKTIKYLVFLAVLSYIVAFGLNFFEPFVESFLGLLAARGIEVPAVGISLNPTDVLTGILNYIATSLNVLLERYGFYLQWVALGIIVSGVLISLMNFLNVRGRLYYITNKRIIFRKKFLTHQVTTIPMDQVVDAVAFKGILGRIFGFGNVIVSLSSGAGVKETMAPEAMGITKPFYKIERELQGIKEPFKVRDLIIKLRETYVEALYLGRIEEELKKTRKGVEKMEKKAVEEKPRVVEYIKKREEKEI